MERIKLTVAGASLVVLGMGMGMLINRGSNGRAVEPTEWTPSTAQEPIVPRRGITTTFGAQCFQICAPETAEVEESKNRPISL